MREPFPLTAQSPVLKNAGNRFRASALMIDEEFAGSNLASAGEVRDVDCRTNLGRAS